MTKPLTGPYYGLHEVFPANDDRQALWAEQRTTVGFDNTELWNLDVTIARFILPRLEAFRNTGKESEEFVKEIDKMIIAFQAIVSDDGMFKVDDAAIIEGIKSFHDNYFSLWN